eukprot:gene14365-20367_t
MALILKARASNLSIARNKLIKFEESTKALDIQMIRANYELSSVSLELSTTKDELSSVSLELSTTKDKLSFVSLELSTTKDKLSSVSLELSTTKEELSSVSFELSTTKDKLSSVSLDISTIKDELSSVSLNLSKTKDELSSVILDLSTTKDEFSSVSFELLQTKDEHGSVILKLLKTNALLRNGSDSLQNALHIFNTKLIAKSEELKYIMSCIVRTDKDIGRSRLILRKLYIELADTQCDCLMVRRQQEKLRNKILQLAISTYALDAVHSVRAMKEALNCVTVRYVAPVLGVEGNHPVLTLEGVW